MINKVVLIGRLTKDPELRYTQSNTPVASFTIAVQRSFANGQGEREADFISVVVWRGTAENCVKYLAKGRLVAVSGRIQTRTYNADDGTRRYITEVIGDEVQFLEWGEKQEQDEGFNTTVENDDELPFQGG